MIEYQRGQYAVSSSVPRRLPCSHVFCTGCLKRCLNYGQLKCPTCFRLHSCVVIDILPVNDPGVYLGTITETEPPSSSTTSPTSPVSRECLSNLADMGFDAHVAEHALRQANGDVAIAVGYLFDPSSMPDKIPSSSPSDQPQSKDDGYEADDDVKNTSIEMKETSSFMSSDLVQLMEMGFSQERAQNALRLNRYNLEGAITTLMNEATPSTDSHDTFADSGQNLSSGHKIGDEVEVSDVGDDSWRRGIVQEIDDNGYLVLVEGMGKAYHWDRIRTVQSTENKTADIGTLGRTSTPNPMLEPAPPPFF